MEKLCEKSGKVWRHFMHDSLYRNSIFLMANTAALAGFGFIFWVVAARIYSTADVGVVSAIMSGASLLGSLSLLGFDYALIKFIPGSDKATLRTHTGLTFAGIASLLTAVIYLLLIPIFVPKVEFLNSSPWWMVSYALLVVATTWNVLTNSIFIAHRVTQYAFIATLFYVLLRLPALYLLKSYGSGGLLLAQIIALAISILFCFAFLQWRVAYKYRVHISKGETKQMASYAFGTYLSNVSGGLPALILPTVILRMLGAKSAAYFYVASLLASLLYIIPNTTSQSLFAESAWNQNDIGILLRKAAKLISVFVLIGFLLMVVAGWFLLAAFGKAYATSGYWLLFFLALTAVPKIASYIFSTPLRLQGHLRPIIAVATAGTIIQLGVSYIGMRLTPNLYTLGLAALLCEVFVAGAYTLLFLHFKRNGRLTS